jgi:PKD repeat protein
MAYVNVYSGTPPFSYVWDNGNSVTVPNGIRTSYSINLDTGYHYVTVTDASGCIARDSAWIFSGAQNFWAYPEFTKARMGGDTLLFHNISGSNYPFLYTTWDFGDTTTGTGQWVSHYYPHADTFQVCMTLHDTVFNYTGQYCDTVIIRHPPPPTCFISIIGQVLSNNSMQVLCTPNIFNAHTSFVCSWGDGNYDSLVYLPSHIYANTGVYNLCLAIYDSTINCSDSSCIVITVTAGNNPYTITTSALPVGISTATQNELNVFPNPAEYQLFFSGEWIGNETNVCVTDLSGRILFSEKSHGNSIDCGGLASGMYFLKIENEKGPAVQSFIRR